jgi:SAM-dependent methyltransferase
VRATAKRYDRAYFDRWYRGAASRIEGRAALRRRVALAVALAERHLERPIRSVLDVGCGEGRWRAELLRLRPRLRYVGVDPSSYVVERFGRRRNLVLAAFGELEERAPGRLFDLVVCADVLHYVEEDELDRGLPGLAKRVGGMAWLEALCREDDVEGDLRGLILRPADSYRRRFRALGLVHAGTFGWLAPELGDGPAELELGQGPGTPQAPVSPDSKPSTKIDQ